MFDIGVVGGGFLGMTLALRLRQEGHTVTLYEAAPSPGGLADSQKIGGYTWDRFYHVILLSDQNLLALLSELGLEKEVEWGTTRTGFYTGGRLHSLSTSLEFLLFRPLNLLQKLRLGATILRASRIQDWEALEEIPVTDWLRRWSGDRVFETIWLPLLRSKLGENYRLASAAFIWATISRMYAARRTGLKREMFGYVRGGYANVLSRFEDRLREEGVDLRFQAPALEVRQREEGATVRTKTGGAVGHDRVVLTLPTNRISSLVPQLTPEEKERLEGVVYQGVICLSLLLREPLGGYYVTNITDDGLPFTGVIEMTALVDPAYFGGCHLVYLPRYLTQSDPAWHRDDTEIEEEFLGGLESMYPAFSRDDVVSTKMARAREVQAISTLGYSRTVMPGLETSLSKVLIVNSAQIAAGTLNLNETVGLAERQADALIEKFKAQMARREDGKRESI